MAEDLSWADESLKEASKLHPTLPEAVAVGLKEILAGSQGERVLRGSDLAKAARALITDMEIPPFETLKNHED